jgi:hypothetical protein
MEIIFMLFHASAFCGAGSPARNWAGGLDRSKTATSHASSIHFSRASHPPSVWIVIFFQLPLSAMRKTPVFPSSQSRNLAAARQHPNGNCSRACQPGGGALSSRCGAGGQYQKLGLIARPVNGEEAAFRFVLLNEPEKGRVDIQLICDERIKPIEAVEAGEIEEAGS